MSDPRRMYGDGNIVESRPLTSGPAAESGQYLCGLAWRVHGLSKNPLDDLLLRYTQPVVVENHLATGGPTPIGLTLATAHIRSRRKLEFAGLHSRNKITGSDLVHVGVSDPHQQD